MKVEIVDNPEAIGYVAANRLIDEISHFVPTEAKSRFVVGLSSGRTMERVLNWVVEIMREKVALGQHIDLSYVQFIQTEAFFPEDPTSEASMMARQLKEKFVDPLTKLLGQEVNVYYPGTEPAIDEMRKKFIEYTHQMDVDFVTLYESGAAKGLRDADAVSGSQEIRWSQGAMRTRDIQLRALDDIRSGEEITDAARRKDVKRVEGDKPQSQAMQRFKDRVVAKDQKQEPKYFVTEGYRAYQNAKKVFIIAEGKNKATAIKRILTDVRLEGMEDEDRRRVAQDRRENPEGTASGATIIDLRRGRNTELLIDEEAAVQLDEGELQRRGFEIQHLAWEDFREGRELGSEFSWKPK